jgi:hypothetical protein
MVQLAVWDGAIKTATSTARLSPASGIEIDHNHTPWEQGMLYLQMQ